MYRNLLEYVYCVLYKCHPCPLFHVKGLACFILREGRLGFRHMLSFLCLSSL